MKKELIEKLRDELPSLMRAWSPCDNDSDYKCAFCNNRSDTNHGDITHAKDCLGIELSNGIALAECETSVVENVLSFFGMTNG